MSRPGNTCDGFFQHYLYELVIKTLVQHNLFYMLHQFLQYHVLSDSKPLVSSNQQLVLKRRVCSSLDAARRARYVIVSVSHCRIVLSGVFAAVSGEHLPARTPAVPGHAEGTKQRSFTWSFHWFIAVNFLFAFTASVHGQ